jgi:hypothetical protein
VDLPESVIKQGIANDAAWMGKFVADLVDPAHSKFAPIVSFCVMPYSALFVHESYAKLKTTDPALAALVSADFEAIVARARHSLKLFEDTHRGIDGQLVYFRDEILAAHHDYFIGRVKRLFRFLARDLGLFSYDSRLISTTHVATFHLGIPPQDLLKKTGAEVRAFTEQYGRYFGHLGAKLDAAGDGTFLSRLDPQKVGKVGDDVRSAEYYDRVFDGAGNPDLNALLTVFRCMTNFASLAIPATDVNGNINYTEFKIRFLTLYQVLGSLKMLRDDPTRTLTARSIQYLAKILGTPEALLILDRSAKPFRNTLMHYNLNPRCDLSKVDLGDPVFGLAPVYYPSYNNLSDLAKVVDQALLDTATALDEWAAL